MFETVLVEACRIRLLDEHLARLARTGASPRAIAAVTALLRERCERPSAATIIRVDVDGDDVRATARPPRPASAVAVHPVRAFDPRDATRLEKRADRAWAEAAEAEALAAGADEPLLVSADGLVGETSRANVFAIVDGKAVTSPVAGILPGITRAWAIARTGATERPLLLAELEGADGVFLTTAGRGVVAVAGFEHPLAASLAREWRAL